MSYNSAIESQRVVRRSYERVRYQTEIVGESKTDQSQKMQVDVNHIVRRYDRTGQLPQPKREPQYGDVSDLNAPYGELIESSRSILDTVGKYVEGAEESARQKQAESAALDAAELAEYRNQKKSPPPTLPPQ